jgi:hypothetical protein
MRIALALSLLASASFAASKAVADPQAPAPGGLRGYQARLEAETVRILGPEVTGAMKESLGAKGTHLWAALSIKDWQARVLAEAPSLERASRVIARRSEVLWQEAKGADAYTSAIVQMASVHAMQRGLVRLLAELGVESTPPPTSPPQQPPSRVRADFEPTTIAPPVRASVAPPPPRHEPVRSPLELQSYTVALDREAFRILAPELEGSVLQGVVAKAPALRAASSVASWKAALVGAHPALTKSAAVLERRAEVLLAEHRVLDAWTSDAAQRAAARGLQAGLDRLLKQFGR